MMDLLLMSACRPGEADRHVEHMDNVRLFHQSLQEQAAGDAHPSSSILFSALRYTSASTA